MQSRRSRSIDVLAVGELLVDFISTDYADSLFDVKTFEKWQGGSPANLSLNLTRLGNRVQLVATVGADAMGEFLTRSLAEAGMDVSSIQIARVPTTLILVTRSQEVSAFEAYRSADCLLQPEHLPDALLQESRIFHTTCFALSKQPAQNTIIAAADRAVRAGCQLSIDLNYAAKIWPNTEQARGVVRDYCSQGALIKISEVDWERLYATPLGDPERVADHFLAMGAHWVCVTMGGDGAYLASADTRGTLPVRPVEVKDTTGAGDAFWSGFLTAFLDGYDIMNCARAGRQLAEIKIGQVGPLTQIIDRPTLYADIRTN